MKLGVCAQVFYNLPFEEALAHARSIGCEAIELPVDKQNPFIDLDEALDGGWRAIRRAVDEAGLEISAISNHQEGQLLLGPHGIDTDNVLQGTPEEKAQFAGERLRKTAQLAQKLEVEIVCGFTGCEDYSRWFPWPLEDGYEQMAPVFRERLLPILDDYEKLGVSFAHECHPKQFAYNLDTAQWAVSLVDEHPSFGFNYDPANLLLAGMDPIAFIAELGSRILHVHAKDGETVKHHVARSGLFAHGNWKRPGRGFRFRVAGWGDISWRQVISELQLSKFSGVLAIEHEDPTMSQLEGIRQAFAHLHPLILKDPPPGGSRWW